MLQILIIVTKATFLVKSLKNRIVWNRYNKMGLIPQKTKNYS
jgi:hypothetical protein